MSVREVKSLVVADGEDGSRLDRWLRRRWPHLGQIQIQKLTRTGQLRVDGGRAKPDTRLAAGQIVRVPAGHNDNHLGPGCKSGFNRVLPFIPLLLPVVFAIRFFSVFQGIIDYNQICRVPSYTRHDPPGNHPANIV